MRANLGAGIDIDVARLVETRALLCANSVSALRSGGLVEGGKDALRITPAGRSAVGTYSPLPRGRALLSVWLAHQALGKAERAILQYVVGRGATGCTKVQVAEATQYAVDGGGFNNALSRLRTLELISGSVLLRASEELLHG